MRDVGDKRLNPVVNFAIVGAAGAAARLAVNPYSVAKLWVETGVPGGKSGSFQAMNWMFRQHGLKGLGRGALVASARAFPHYGITFAVYDRVASAYVDKPKGKPTIESLIATYVSGAVGGAVATLVTHPLDVVKTRLVVQPGGSAAYYNGAVDAASKIAREGIFSGVYRGLGVSVIGAATFWGTGFLAWELVDQLPWPNKRPFVPFEWFLWPCLAVGVATVASHPFDVIRRKTMAQSYILPRDGGVDIRFRNIFGLVMGIWRAHGVYGFYHGLLANSLKIVPQLAVFWAVFATGQMSLTGGSSARKATA